MGPVIYALCALTALVCSALLLRGYARNRSRLLFWAGLCFAGLALNNALVFADLVLVPQIDLSLLRNLTALGGIASLVYGLVWDVK